MSKFKAIRWLTMPDDKRISLVWTVGDEDSRRCFTTRKDAQKFAKDYGLKGDPKPNILTDVRP